MVIGVSGKDIRLQTPGPRGVRGRNSDNRLIKQLLGLRPEQCFQAGIEKTMPWIDGK